MKTSPFLYRRMAAVVLALAGATAGAQGQAPSTSLGTGPWTALGAGSQTAVPEPGKDADIMLMWHGATAGMPFDVSLPPGGMDMAFMTPPLAIAGETVANAPYSAEAITEVVQTLADGNRIVHESRTSLYRDSAGRTRHEQGLAVVGPLVGGGTPGMQIQISDPVAGVSYLLNMEQRHAIRMPLPKFRFAPSTGARTDSMNRTFEVAVAPPPGGAQGAVFFSKRMAVNMGTPVLEQLGKQTLEGVEAQGTRSTLTIPAGAIGNERPISVVSERWYSPELKTLIMTRQSDPRYGETTYKLLNILRSEPSADLFQAPPDFTVIDPPAGNREVIMKMERKN